MKNSFVIYTDYMEQVELLTMEQRGILFTSIMAYASEKELPDMDGMTKMAFSFIKATMDRDMEKYRQTVISIHVTAKVTTTGNCGASFSTGEESTSYAGCVNSVAAALGLNAKAKGVKGAYIICAEFETDNDGNYRIKGIQLHQVDGEKIKEETYYQLIDGVMTEVD